MSTQNRASETTQGLALFRNHKPASRKRRITFLVIYAVVVVMLTWPVFPRFAAAEPLILGLPISFAWVVAALLIMFGALIWLYRSDNHDDAS